VDTFNDEEWSYVFEDLIGKSTNILNIYTNEINEDFSEKASFIVYGVNRQEPIDFEVSFIKCPGGPHHTYYGPKAW